jgi:hypothetical protein
MFEGKRAQQKRIHDAEYQGVRADSQGQREHRYCREAAIARHHSDRVPKVLQESLHRSSQVSV